MDSSPNTGRICTDRQGVVLAGPTAVGKTEIGIELADALDGEIISADSRQVYKYMDIGTAKPTAAQRQRVRHHLVDIRNPDEAFSAGEFGRQARRLINALAEGGHPPVMVGGSGLYLSAALDGFFDDDGTAHQLRSHLLQRLRKEGLPHLYRELSKLDPVTHQSLQPNDSHRIVRALELAHSGTGTRSERSQRQLATAFRNLPPLMFCLTMDRQRLYRRIDDRVDAMISDGWVEEVDDLRQRGYDADCCGLDTLGYLELSQHLDGKTSLEEATVSIKRRSRQYAKRQLTWFRRDRRFRWLDLDVVGAEGALERILAQCGSSTSAM